ncbi:MAG: hypothetical protein H7Y88_04250 [Phycisphaerales bacterium]|nr:hypothetical protein [Phycisphaerales bacterium]
MVDPTDRPAIGPYVLTRELPDCVLPGGHAALRWVALHETEQSSHLIYRFTPPPPSQDKYARSALLGAVKAAASLRHSHIWEIARFGYDDAGYMWVVGAYPGDVTGLLTLGRLLRDKGGQMSAPEAERAVLQVLEAVEQAWSTGRSHGPVGMDEVLVDRHGSLLIELYGVGRGMLGLIPSDPSARAEFLRDEVRSVVEIGYQLITGLRAESPVIPPARLVKKLDPAWDAWLRRGLDPLSGFDSPSEALGALPSRVVRTETRGPIVQVRNVLGRFGSASR